jgi:hypothetical protein
MNVDLSNSIDKLEGSINNACREIDRLRELKAELLEALELIIACNKPDGLCRTCRITAEAAIKKARRHRDRNHRSRK